MLGQVEHGPDCDGRARRAADDGRGILRRLDRSGGRRVVRPAAAACSQREHRERRAQFRRRCLVGMSTDHVHLHEEAFDRHSLKHAVTRHELSAG